jgi:hypothetical protein
MEKFEYMFKRAFMGAFSIYQNSIKKLLAFVFESIELNDFNLILKFVFFY